MDALIELFFSQRFKPAESWEDTTVQYTTDEIRGAISNHTGNNKITTGEIYDWLSINGYIFDSAGGLDLVWLMIEI